MKFLINHIKQQYHIKDYKFGLIISVVAISVIGIMMVGSAKPDFMTKQIMGVILGFGAMVVVSLIDYKWIMNFYWILYVINLILLIAVKIPGLGHSANGAQRWINLGFMQLQPSDLTKILLIIFFARFFSDRELKISSPKVIIQSVRCYSVAHPYCDTAESFHYNLYRSAFLCSHFSGRIKLQICRNSSCDYDSCRCDLSCRCGAAESAFFA